MRFLLFFFLGIFTMFVSAQSKHSDEKDVVWADSILTALKNDDLSNAEFSRSQLDSAVSIYKKADELCKYLDASVRLSSALTDLGYTDRSLAILFQIENEYESTCDSSFYMQILANYSYIYLNLDDFRKIDSICSYGLSIWNDDWNMYETKLIMLNNWSISQAYQGEIESAENLFRRTLRDAIKHESIEYQVRALTNLGTIKGMQMEVDSAYYFLDSASRIAADGGDFNSQIPILINLVQIELIRKDYAQAHAILDSAFVIAERIDNLDYIGMVQLSKSEVFENSGDFEPALQSLRAYINTREQFLNREKVKAISEMEEKYETAKRKNEIQDLKIENLDAELRNEKITKSRNRFMIGGIGIVLFAMGLYSRLRYVRRSKQAIQKEKDISEGLLLNILPAEVADELKQKGTAEAQLIEEVTVLFTDFKGFTAMAEVLSPRELVNDLNICFSEFDVIMEKYGIEKIKTIGDAYMAAGGLPTPNSTHAQDVINAAFELRDFVENGKARKMEQGLPFFEIRIGIHSGPVVAGIVGVKKFQYDIWGDTVNTASRMESSGEVGQVNISEASYELVKDNQAFKFSSRGKIKAKGKGEMEMYFVERNDS